MTHSSNALTTDFSRQVSPPPKLFLRFSDVNDLDKVVRFYQENKTPHVFMRDTAVWQERAAAGAITIIEDEAGRIVASSISYPILSKGEAGGEGHKWTEIGSTLIALQNTGLFRTLVSAQALRAWLAEKPSEGFVLEIVAGNQRSVDVFEKIGSKPFTVPPELFHTVQKTFTTEGQDRVVKWYTLGETEIAALARNILETQALPALENKKTGQAYELDFSRSPFHSHLRQDVQRLAGLEQQQIAKPAIFQL